ncbi:MAG: SBBP repeat-containing protein [candidate division Zixibacteria bacterium]|nr:SBBP repeat-containing protein [candidate division Zixibacteria bacterium]
MRKKLLLLVLSMFWALPCFAQQVDTAWVRPGGSRVAVDQYSSVYVAGSYQDDYFTTKYDSEGNELWLRTYNGPGNGRDMVRATALDNGGNIYVTGESEGDGTGYDFATIKYYPNGDTAWVRRYDRGVSSNDYPSAIAVDANGRVYVTGSSDSAYTICYFTTVEYDAEGNEVWVRAYIGPGGRFAHATSIVVDHTGNVCVTGSAVYDTLKSYDYATIKYYPNGDTAWLRWYDGDIHLQDYPVGIGADTDGNIYVAGATNQLFPEYWEDFGTIKYYPNGDTAWVRRFDFHGCSEVPLDMAVDPAGNIYVTGFSTAGSNGSFMTVKYGTNGDLAWSQYTRLGSNPRWQQPNAIAVDRLGNAYVTGYIGQDSLPVTNHDCVTIKYHENGYQHWIVTYNGPGNSDEEASDIVVDDSNNIYITGTATIKYVQMMPLPGVDLSASLLADRRASPGFQKTYLVVYENLLGDNAENVVMSAKLPKEVQYVSCSPTCNVNGRDISWNLGTVAGLSGGSANVTFYIPASISVGTVLKGTAKISTTSKDENPRNNRSDEQEEVVNSWDPNDKEAQPWGDGTAKYVMPDQPLRYTIFFENDSSATAEAIYIDIVDTLDANLDWSTLQIGPLSHPDTCQASFDPISGVLTWHCDSIMLPPNHNPPEGEGFVSFWANPDSGLPSGTQIKNRAYIKFDYNPWIAAPDSGPVVRTIGKFGDANADGQLTVSDVIYLVNYLFKGGSEPAPFEAGDVNCDAAITVSDVVYLVNYLFKGGPPPAC